MDASNEGASPRRSRGEKANSDTTPPRRVPPGCCPGCLLSYEGDCPLHRTAADLLAACERLERYAHNAYLDDEEPEPDSLRAELQAVVADARAAVAKAKGR